MYQAPEIKHLEDAVRAIRDGLMPAPNVVSHDKDDDEFNNESDDEEDEG